MDKTTIDKYLERYAAEQIRNEVFRLAELIKNTKLPGFLWGADHHHAVIKEMLFPTQQHEKMCIDEIKQRRLAEILDNISALRDLELFGREE